MIPTNKKAKIIVETVNGKKIADAVINPLPVMDNLITEIISITSPKSPIMSAGKIKRNMDFFDRLS